MKLYTFFENDNKIVYGTAVGGKTFFFYKGFASADDAKKATSTLHLEYKKSSHPNAPVGMLQAEIDMVLEGEWSEIE